MPSILCYGDSNTWGAPPALPGEDIERYSPGQRWPGVLSQQLGEDYQIYEHGLSGRTTCYRDPVQGAHLCGRDHLPVSLATCAPLDLVILMLGTNDLKRRFNASAAMIANNVGTLVELTRAFSGEDLPILVICPPPARAVDLPRDAFAGAAKRSVGLAQEFARMATELDVALLDAGEFVVSSEVDGIHLDANAHRMLGEVIADKVRQII